MSIVNRAKSPLFFHSKVSKLDFSNSRTVSINSRTASNVLRLDSSLDPRSFRVSTIEDRVESFEFRVIVNSHLTHGVQFVIIFQICKQFTIISSVLPSLTFWICFEGTGSLIELHDLAPWLKLTKSRLIEQFSPGCRIVISLKDSCQFLNDYELRKTTNRDPFAHALSHLVGFATCKCLFC